MIRVFCASIMYPTGLGRFDLEYFAHRHVPRFAELLGPNCVHYEVHQALAVPGAPEPPYVAAAHVWVQSAEEFGTVLAEHGQEIYADIDQFSSGQPIRAWSLVRDRPGGATPTRRPDLRGNVAAHADVGPWPSGIATSCPTSTEPPTATAGHRRAISSATARCAALIVL